MVRLRYKAYVPDLGEVLEVSELVLVDNLNRAGSGIGTYEGDFYTFSGDRVKLFPYNNWFDRLRFHIWFFMLQALLKPR